MKHTKGKLTIIAYEGGWTGIGIRDKKLGDHLLFKLAFNNEANAEHLVLCWNSHDDLLAALILAKEHLEAGLKEISNESINSM